MAGATVNVRWADRNAGLFLWWLRLLPVATHQPPHLEAIIPGYATDDRYTDDCHYRGGLFRYYYDFALYGAWMIAMNALPPCPEFSGADWAHVWEEHLEQKSPYMLRWIEEQVDEPYWRPGPPRGQYEKVQCPTFIVGGWRDSYPNPPLRVYAELKDRVPIKVLIGPWNHGRPDSAVPGPQVLPLVPVRGSTSPPTFELSPVGPAVYGARVQMPPWQVVWDVLGNEDRDRRPRLPI